MTARFALRIICENTVGRPLPLLGEHGFACLVDSPAGRFLFDTGRGLTLLHNLRVLEIDPHSIEAIVLSHGHDDHGGGLLPLLQVTGPRPVYANHGIFAERCHLGDGRRRDIGLAVSRSGLEAAGARFRFVESCTELAPGVWFSGPIPRISPLESGDPCLCRLDSAGQAVADPLDDDAALAIETENGLVILLGCAHAGVVNTVEHFRACLPDRPVQAIVGGTHLGPVGEPQFAATVAYLENLGVERLGVAHCTGQQRGARLFRHFPEQVFFASAGTAIEF